jgi:hypothetical protein
MRELGAIGCLLIVLFGAAQLARALSGTSPATVANGTTTSPGARDLFFYRNVGASGPGTRWYGSGITGAALVAIGALQGNANAHVLFATPFYVERSVTLDSMSVRVSAIPTGAGNCRFGIYNNSSDTALIPTTMVYDVGVAVPVTTTGVKTCPGIASCTTPNVTLTANTLYWTILMLDCLGVGLPTTTTTACSGTQGTGTNFVGWPVGAVAAPLGIDTGMVASGTWLQSAKVASGAACCGNALATWPAGTNVVLTTAPVALAIHVSVAN